REISIVSTINGCDVSHLFNRHPLSSRFYRDYQWLPHVVLKHHLFVFGKTSLPLTKRCHPAE
ncbi:MAG: hypothetical protein KAT56_03875, partial [Sedimentisphaerales bacterium]|nr:hypothetical protein [Sedimentisphaerales bacterium]